VSRLRTVLGAERIERRAPGYRLRVDAEELDFGRFEVLLEHGQAAVAAGDAGEGAELLRAALALWRGRALADLEYESFLGAEAEWLEERRLLAFEALVDAELAVGAGPELIAELEVAARGASLPRTRTRPVDDLPLSGGPAGRCARALPRGATTFRSGTRTRAESGIACVGAEDSRA
jgi:Bacterial transcriptional activator domain